MKLQRTQRQVATVENKKKNSPVKGTKNPTESSKIPRSACRASKSDSAFKDPESMKASAEDWADMA